MLRVRQEGREHVQTAKGPGRGGFERLEHNVQLDGASSPDPSLHAGHPVGKALRAALDGHADALQPVLETDIIRRSRVLKAAGTAVEIALDEGRIRADGAHVPVLELEFELKEGSPYRFMAESGLEATQKHEGLLGNVDMNTWVSMSIQRAIDNIQARTQDGLAFLATVGSTAPFVGLFGTVWGIYHALTAIGVAGQASIDKVAGPVGEALIMPAIGLAVAVPAVLGYNWLVRRNKAAMDRVRSFGADLHAVLLSASQSPVKA